MRPVMRRRRGTMTSSVTSSSTTKEARLSRPRNFPRKNPYTGEKRAENTTARMSVLAKGRSSMYAKYSPTASRPRMTQVSRPREEMRMASLAAVAVASMATAARAAFSASTAEANAAARGYGQLSGSGHALPASATVPAGVSFSTVIPGSPSGVWGRLFPPPWPRPTGGFFLPCPGRRNRARSGRPPLPYT